MRRTNTASGRDSAATAGTSPCTAAGLRPRFCAVYSTARHMKLCPTCGKPGVPEHSVHVTPQQLASMQRGEDPSVFSKCLRCGAVFGIGPSGELVKPAPDILADESVWIVPPKKSRAASTAFESSWDVVEAFFERQAAATTWVRPMFALVQQMRSAGYDRRLRAGQSLNSLGLSRSRQHGLRADQSNLFVIPSADETIRVEGTVRGIRVVEGPWDPALTEGLRSVLEKLAAVAVD